MTLKQCIEQFFESAQLLKCYIEIDVKNRVQQ